MSNQYHAATANPPAGMTASEYYRGQSDKPGWLVEVEQWRAQKAARSNVEIKARAAEVAMNRK